LNSNTGPCTIKGNLPEDVALIKSKAKVYLYIDNSKCKKMVKKTMLKVHRKMSVKANDVTGVEKEWTDD